MKKNLLFYTFIIILAVIGFQYWIVLDEQKAHPSEEWSRSLPATVDAGDYSKMQIVPTEEGTGISLFNFKKMDYLECSENMQCTKKWTNSELNPYKNTWSDGDKTYFINKEDSLVLSTANANPITISPNVENFAISGDTLIYWLKDKQILVQQGVHEPVTFTPEYPVHTAVISDGHVFIVTRNTQENRFALLDGTNDFKELFQFHLNPSENLTSMSITKANDDQFTFLLDTEIISGGARKKVIRNASFNLDENQAPEMKEIAFADQETGSKLTDIRNPVIYESEDGLQITFSAYMVDATGEKVNKVFAGKYDEEFIEALAVTKKGDLYIQPLFVDDQTIAYFKTNGKEKQLMYSSSVEEVRDETANGLKGDTKEAFYNLLTLLFNGFLLVLLSITWLIPALGIGYGTVAVLQKTRNPHAHLIAWWAGTIAMFASQLVLFATAFHPDRIVVASPFLTEVWQVLLLIVITLVLSLLPLFLTRTKVTYDNFNPVILYTFGMNLVILFLLIGPYFL